MRDQNDNIFKKLKFKWIQLFCCDSSIFDVYSNSCRLSGIFLGWWKNSSILKHKSICISETTLLLWIHIDCSIWKVYNFPSLLNRWRLSGQFSTFWNRMEYVSAKFRFWHNRREKLNEWIIPPFPCDQGQSRIDWPQIIQRIPSGRAFNWLPVTSNPILIELYNPPIHPSGLIETCNRRCQVMFSVLWNNISYFWFRNFIVFAN